MLLAELEAADESPAAEAPAEPTSKRQRVGAVAAARGGSCPPHPGFMGGICIRCGALKPSEPAEPGSSPPDGSPLALKYIHHGLEVSRGEAARLRAGTVQRALSSRRLLLVLDLDHTLLHSTRMTDLTPPQTAALRAVLALPQPWVACVLRGRRGAEVP